MPFFCCFYGFCTPLGARYGVLLFPCTRVTIKRIIQARFYPFGGSAGPASTAPLRRRIPRLFNKEEPPTQETKTLQAKMFGGLQIHVGDQCLVEKGGRVNKPIELLVYLLLNIGVQVSNEQIMEALWGDDEVENPAGALKNAAYSLRRLLTKAGLSQDCIITRERQYAWNPDVPVELDIDRFNELYETAMQTPGTPTETVVRCCRAALALYAGDFLPALSDRYWLMARASTLRQRYLSMVLHLSDLLLNGSDRTGAEEVMNLCSRALLLGAYFCPYEVFKHMYHMVVRSATRNSEDVILLLVTLVPLEVPKQEMIRVMLAVKELIKNMLRKGDVFARYSRNQYVLMLSVKDTDDYKVVRDRLLSRYEKSGLSQNLRMQVTIGIPDPIV